MFLLESLKNKRSGSARYGDIKFQLSKVRGRVFDLKT